MRPQSRQQLRSHGEDRVERQIGVLRDKADAGASDIPLHLPLGQRDQVVTFEPDASRLDDATGGEYAQDRAQQGGFAAARLAHQRHDPSTWDAEIDVVQNARDTAIAVDDGTQAAHRQDRLGQRDRRSRGSAMSRSPSPSRLKPSTTTRIARPGNVEYHQASGR